MKFREHSRLAKISLKARKKTTRSTVRGISFGLVLLTPIIFLATGLLGGLSAQLNENPSAIYTNVTYGTQRSGITDVPTSKIDTYKQVPTLGYNNKEKLLKIAKNNQKIVYEYFDNSVFYSTISNDQSEQVQKFSSTRISIGGGQEMVLVVKSPIRDGQGTTLSGVTVFDTEASKIKKKQDIFPETLLKNFDKDGFVEGADGGFTGDGKGQIIVSEVFLKSNNLTLAEVYGKTISIKQRYNVGVSTNSTFIDADENPNDATEAGENDSTRELYLCQNYEIVGVVKENIAYASSSIGAQHPNASLFYFTKASLIMPNGKAIEPVYTTIENEKNGNSDYKSYCINTTMTMSKDQIEVLNQEYLGIAPFGGGYSNLNVSWHNVTAESVYGPQEHIMYIPKNYTQNNDIVKEVIGAVEHLNDVDSGIELSAGTAYLSSMAVQMEMIFKISTIAMLVLGIFGGIVLFAALVNLFNTIMHSVDLRKNYLGVMRAIGAKSKEIPRLYIFETIHIFLKSSFWIVLLGGGACVGIKLGIDALMKELGGSILGISFTVGWGYLPLTLFAVFGTLFLTGWAFAYGCSKKVATLPITEVLNEGV